ncbi:hypothetical protein BGZ83_004754 [Gryganskiella cystojenkinii]|nr:hypothetical protein BGZ83_004754 [Gryganskiella cystojenkinii]
MFKLILWAFSVMEAASHLVFAAYSWYKQSTFSEPDSDIPHRGGFQQSASPVTATLCSLISFAIGMAVIKDTKLIRKEILVVWTVASLIPLFLMIGAGDFSFEWLWWSMPLMLQVVDLASLWVMQEPEEEFFGLEQSRYKLKGA